MDDTQLTVQDGARVVVVGAGPVGLAAALLLARKGVATTLLEERLEPSPHPKARGIRPRTMELFMQWGIADPLYEIALPDEANRFIYCDTLAGEEYARTAQIEPDSDPTTLARPCRVAQDSAQHSLREAALAEPLVTLHRGARITEVAQDDTGVTATDAKGRTYRGDYLIAADGASSTIRHLLGIKMEGKPVIGYGQSVYWRGDMTELTAHRLCIQYMTGARRGKSVSIASVDGRERWVTMIMQPASEERPVPPTPEEAIEIIRDAVGTDIDPEIIDIATWRISSQVAEKWQQGRVFLAGDAAHAFPPTGGFGMNTGIQDSHNLAWKLAAVLSGSAAPSLLESYESERQPVSRGNAAWSSENGVRFKRIAAAIAAHDDDELATQLEAQKGHVDATDQDLAFQYSEGAIAGDDPNTGSPLHEVRRGSRLPEMQLDVDGTPRSSNSDPIEGFQVVVSDPALLDAGSKLLTRLSLPGVATLTAKESLSGVESALVRPDGIVAWYGPGSVEAWERAMHEVLGQSL